MPKIRVVGFDQGGVLMDLDYTRTIEQFRSFGATDVEQVYSQADQVLFFDQFERGEIAAPVFRSHLRKAFKLTESTMSDLVLDEAWSALLLDYQKERLEFVRELKQQGYITFMFANINEIHYPVVLKLQKKCAVEDYFTGDMCCFHEQYLSHLRGYNKPYATSFRRVAKDLRDKYDIADPCEILFVDDSSKHIFGRPGCTDEGALAAGWHGLVVQSNLSANDLRTAVTDSLKPPDLLKYTSFL